MRRQIAFILALTLVCGSSALQANCKIHDQERHSSFTEWSEKVLECATTESRILEDREDMDWWDRLRVTPFYTEFFIGKNVGRFERSAYGIPIREWKNEDLEKILENTRMMLTLAKSNGARRDTVEHLERMAERLEEMNTPASRYQREALRRYRNPPR